VQQPLDALARARPALASAEHVDARHACRAQQQLGHEGADEPGGAWVAVAAVVVAVVLEAADARRGWFWHGRPTAPLQGGKGSGSSAAMRATLLPTPPTDFVAV